MNANSTVKFHNGIRFQDELLILLQSTSDLLHRFWIHRLILVVVERDLSVGLQMLLFKVELILIFDLLNVLDSLLYPILVRDYGGDRLYFHG